MENNVIFDTRYFEKYALLSLQSHYDESWRSFVLGESPDLQSVALDVGIEVTRALWQPGPGVLSRYANEYMGERLQDNKARACETCGKRRLNGQHTIVFHGLNRQKLQTSKIFWFRSKRLARLARQAVFQYEPMQSQVKVVQDMAVFSQGTGQRGFRVHIESLAHAILRKTKKLNKNYRVFGNNHLYIFTFDLSLDVHRVAFAVRQAQKQIEHFPLQYQTVFINCLDKLFAASVQSGEIKTLPLNHQRIVENERIWAMKSVAK